MSDMIPLLSAAVQKSGGLFRSGLHNYVKVLCSGGSTSSGGGREFNWTSEGVGVRVRTAGCSTP